MEKHTTDYTTLTVARQLGALQKKFCLNCPNNNSCDNCSINAEQQLLIYALDAIENETPKLRRPER